MKDIATKHPPPWSVTQTNSQVTASRYRPVRIVDANDNVVLWTGSDERALSLAGFIANAVNNA